MDRLFPDTHPKIEELQIELPRRAEPWQKLEMVWQMNAAVRRMLICGLRTRHPDDPAEMINRRLADMLLGETLAEQVYGPLEGVVDAG